MLWPILDVIHILLFIFLITLLFYFWEPLNAQVLWCWGYYLFIFSSGMECRTLSQWCGMLYFPIFLFRVGLFTLTYMTSLMAHAILCPSLPMILKSPTDVVWLVLFWCSKIGGSAFKCSLYISPNALDDSHIYSSSQSILLELNH